MRFKKASLRGLRLSRDIGLSLQEMLYEPLGDVPISNRAVLPIPTFWRQIGGMVEDAQAAMHAQE